MDNYILKRHIWKDIISNPDNAISKLQYADILDEENILPDLSRGLRWSAKHEKHPGIRSMGISNEPYYGWHESIPNFNENDGPLYSVVGRLLLCSILVSNKNKQFFSTIRGAITALGKGLKEMERILND